MIISRTPFRVSFFGGGTDYPVWFEENGGQVISCTIDKYCYISARWLPPFFEYKHRIVWSQIEAVDDTSDIAHPSVKACMDYLDITDGIEVHHNGDLPARSGLGSSSSFTVGMLNALNGLCGKMVGRPQLAKDAIHIEQQVLSEAVGVQDQTAVAHGGFNHIEIRKDGRCLVNPITLSKQRSTEFEKHLMLFFTGISRYANEIAQTQISETKNKQNELARMGDMVEEALNVLNSSSPMSEFGSLLNESWKIKRGLTNKISNSHIDDIYTAAQDAGAYGGKLLGAGGGGFMLIFAAPENQDAIRDKLKGVLEIPISLEYDGSRIIYCAHS